MKSKNVVADSGYGSEENYAFCEELDEWICTNEKRLIFSHESKQ